MSSVPAFREQAKVARVSKVLRDAKVGAILWGEQILRALGAPFPARGIQFLIEDDQFHAAYRALVAEARDICPNDKPAECVKVHMQTPHPEAEVHVCFDGTPVNLYRRSVFIPSLAPWNIKDKAVDPEHYYFVDAADHRLPYPHDGKGGRYHPDLDLVVMPRPNRFIRALIKLSLREDADPDDCETYKLWLMSMRLNTRTTLINPYRLESEYREWWEKATSSLNLGKF